MNKEFNNAVSHDREISTTSSLKYDPKARPIWEIAAEISAQVPDSEWRKVPTDLAKNFDKYQTQTAIEDCE